ncbi:SMI1/KNR4 family protein [Piscinibacter gummiphilus]|uniref:SMI1/KNR4 family protein n=1 Tax=Piscinibacter gummiphilus TaxID=946333 RepID=A0ABZ0CQU1_9BURK|nr:SMI1/KNR4 family protein [Piscinibacter gummiphilus]WOB06891.1 SMI1/KNR4 family protein [Piscinibacter gummiphilus]
MSWPTRISQYQELAKELHELMFGAASPYLPPNAGATDDQLKQLETQIDAELDSDYKEFLRCANGWPSFTGSISLLGSELATQTKELAFANRNVGAISGAALGPYKKLRRILIPVGVSNATLDVICMVPNSGKVNPETICFNNTEPDVYPSFSAFFDMVASTLPTSIDHYSKRHRTRGA